MSSSIPPIVAAWELALRLRNRRRQLGIDVKAITQLLGFSRNYWSAVENERKILSEESLTKLLVLFEFDAGERQELLELRAMAKERDWWAQYSGLLAGEVLHMFGLESGAQHVRDYESSIVPGLLQTADYARAIIAPNVTIRPVEVEQLVEVRQKRQERLVGDNPLHVTAILGEAVLRQQIGGTTVFRRQLEHLLTMAEAYSGSIEIRVIPFTATSCGLFGSAPMHLIDFDDSRLPTLAWQEAIASWGLIDDLEQVRNISMTYSDALESALGKRESLELIRRCSKDIT